MTSRKRPLDEVVQLQATPARTKPSTPHAIRALQQRSGAKIRSSRSARHVNTQSVRPDSIRGVLRRFAKISAPATKKRIVTPSSIYADKENQRPQDLFDDPDDSILLHKPALTSAIEELVEDDESELVVAPTPSILPEDVTFEQPTITFQNVTRIPIGNTASDRSERRKSYLSLVHSEPLTGQEEVNSDDAEGETTIMTERGRRALSEEATGRLSRYSFGSIRMSDFGSELEIQRDSENYQKVTSTEPYDYVPLDGDVSLNLSDAEDVGGLRRSPSIDDGDDTANLFVTDDKTFRLEMPQDVDEADAQQSAGASAVQGVVALSESSPVNEELELNRISAQPSVEVDLSSRRQTLLEAATTHSHPTRQKRAKLTRHGTTVPSLPTSLIKRVVLDSYEKQSKRKPKLGRDHMKALEQATEWFFEQASEDLAAYSSHGRRKKRVDMDDVLLLMRRQKVLVEAGELKSFAKSWLPRDILQGLDLPEVP